MGVVVRPWRPGDEEGATAVLREGSFSNLWPSFKIALRRPSILVLACVNVTICWWKDVSFVSTLWLLLGLVAGVYLSCLLATLIFFYGSNFNDMRKIQSSYFDSPDNHFWVAEADGQIVGTIGVVRKRAAEEIHPTNNPSKTKDISTHIASNDDNKFVNKSVPHHRNNILHSRSSRAQNKQTSEPVTCNQQNLSSACSIKPISDSAPPKVAWLRRMAVRNSHRGQGIAKQLVQTLVDFCRAQNYDSIFLITTEVHQPARALYERAGFQQTAFKPHKHCAGLVEIWRYEYEMKLH
jgi:GNAT superfamily N-acetyltransferase